LEYKDKSILGCYIVPIWKEDHDIVPRDMGHRARSLGKKGSDKKGLGPDFGNLIRHEVLEDWNSTYLCITMNLKLYGVSDYKDPQKPNSEKYD
jgi:hypothetical protein